MRENKVVISKVLRRVKPYWGHLILSLLLALLYVAMSRARYGLYVLADEKTRNEYLQLYMRRMFS